MYRRLLRYHSIVITGFLIAVVSLLIASSVAAEEIGWPRHFNCSVGKITIYQPQVQSLKGNRLGAMAAITVSAQRSKTAHWGTIWFTARLTTNRQTRTADLLDAKVSKITFPHVRARQAANLSKCVRAVFDKLDLTMSLDRLMLSVQCGCAKKPDPPDTISTAPPKIIYVNQSAILISIDGQPIMEPITDTSLMRVVNTPFFIVLDPATSQYYLYGAGGWYSSQDIVAGTWISGATPPAEVADALQASQTQLNVPLARPASGPPPAIIVATEPTELISSDGDPQYSPITGGQLLYMGNTDRDVFLVPSTQSYYVLLSGRWYSSQSLQNGPWTYVPPDQLPASFYSIPEDSPEADVLEGVAGTPEANDALADAQIPQTATINRDTPGPKVTYDGDPRFENIPGTDVSYALNTGFQVLNIGNSYYCCYQGVWYTADDPLGPWVVATSVPSDVQLIPPTCPDYNCTDAYIYGYTPDVVYCGYTSGYLGCYPLGPTVVWGTGYYYPGWWGTQYFPRACTWGFGAGFVPFTEEYAFGIGFEPDWFDFGFGWGYHWNRWWGPGGYRDFYVDMHHRREGDMDRPFHQWDQDLYNRPDNFVRNVESPQPRFLSGLPPSAGEENNVFASGTGDIYRRTSTGWQERGATRWSGNVAPPSFSGGAEPAPVSQSPPASLEPEFWARQRGETLTNDFRSFHNGGFQPRGGGFGGGSGFGGRIGGFGRGPLRR